METGPNLLRISIHIAGSVAGAAARGRGGAAVSTTAAVGDRFAGGLVISTESAPSSSSATMEKPAGIASPAAFAPGSGSTGCGSSPLMKVTSSADIAAEATTTLRFFKPTLASAGSALPISGRSESGISTLTSIANKYFLLR